MIPKNPGILSAVRQSPFALPVLALGIVLSLAAWRYAGDLAEQKARTQFQLHADDTRYAIAQRLDRHIELLRGARGLFAASDQVSRDEWRRYVGSLDLHRFPGIQGLGFIRRLRPDEVPAFERRLRAETGDRAFAVEPPGRRVAYYPIDYIESLEPGLKVLGLDHGAYAAGREALERARDLGAPAVSSRLVSPIDAGKKPRVMIVLPVFRHGMVAADVPARRGALLGFIYARLKLDELLGGAISAALHEELDFEIYDGGAADRVAAPPVAARLLYDADEASPPNTLNPAFRPRFRDTQRLEVAGRHWLLNIADRDASTLRAGDKLRWLMLGGGLLLSLAATALVVMLSTARARIEREVQRQKSLFAQVLDILPINVFIKDPEARFVMVNAQCAKLFGLPKEAVIGKNDFDVFPAAVAQALRDYDNDVRAADDMVMREERLVSRGKDVLALAGKTMIRLEGSPEPLLLGFSIDISERKKMEQSLREAEARFRGILDNTTAIIYIKDLDGRYLLVNRQYERLFRLSAADIVGKTDYDISPQELADAYRANDRQVIAAGRAVEFEELAQHDDGLHAYVSVKFPLVGAQGEPCALCGISTDITERLNLEREAAAARANRLSRAITDAVGEGIIGADALMRVVFANPKAQELLGITESQMLGRKLDDVVRVVAEDGRSLGDETWQTWTKLAGGEAFDSDAWSFTRGDGSLVGVNLVLAPIFESGQPAGAVLSFNDITRRRQAEAALAKAERLQKAFLDNLPEMAWFKDKDSRYIMMNEASAAASRFPLDEIPGKTDFDLWPRELAELYRADDRTVMASGQRKRVEEPFEDKDGRRIWIETIKSPIYDDKGRVIGTVGTARDITQRKRDEAELKRHIDELARMNAELDEFSYVASHDLQEPLRKMISFSDWLKRDLGDNLSERAAKDLAFIVDAASRMQSLVQDLLALSRAGKMSMVHEWVRLDDAANRALDALALRVAETGATITRDALPAAWGDPALLTQLYQNLIGNALKFVGSAPPQIHLSTEQKSGGWVFGVRDNGIGIKPEYAEQIFQPFKRLHGRGEYEGSGIGLAVCRKVVERHRGRIWVESEEGRGAHFKFVLPAVRKES